DVGLEAVERLDGDLDADLLGMGEALARGVDQPAPLLFLGAVGNDLADGARNERDDLAVKLADHRQHVLDILHGTFTLALIPGGEIALAEHKRDGAPAADAVFLEQRTRFRNLVDLRLAGN